MATDLDLSFLSGVPPEEDCVLPRPDRLEQTLTMPSLPSGPPSREELVEFIRCICEGDVPISSGGPVSGVRAIELAAWGLYRRLQEGSEI